MGTPDGTDACRNRDLIERVLSPAGAGLPTGGKITFVPRVLAICTVYFERPSTFSCNASTRW
jgi:hypothetical protein